MTNANRYETNVNVALDHQLGFCFSAAKNLPDVLSYFNPSISSFDFQHFWRRHPFEVLDFCSVLSPLVRGNSRNLKKNVFIPGICSNGVRIFYDHGRRNPSQPIVPKKAMFRLILDFLALAGSDLFCFFSMFFPTVVKES